MLKDPYMPAKKPDAAGEKNEHNPLALSHQLLWEGLPEPTRGPKPTLTLDHIVAAAIDLTDRQGLAALSMRRLADELGVGTMSLYRYIPGKEQLLDLMLDRVSAPQRPAGSTWRDTLESSAWEGRRLYLRHSWLLQINWTRPVLGPNSILGLEVTLSGLHDLPFSDQEKLMVVSLLDSFVTGSARSEVQWASAREETGITDEEFWSLQLPWLTRAMESGDYPTMAGLSEDTFDAGWDETFAMGLDLLLDGIAQRIQQHP